MLQDQKTTRLPTEAMNYLAGWLDLGGGAFTSILHMAPGTGPTGAATDTKQAKQTIVKGRRSRPEGRTLDGLLGCEVRRASHQEPATRCQQRCQDHHTHDKEYPAGHYARLSFLKKILPPDTRHRGS